jgi:cytochrome c oxidase subunit IV
MDHTARGHGPSSTRTYYIVYLALILLLVLTVVVYRIDLGGWSPAISLSIAMVKAVLVVLFFMHVLYSSRLTKLVIGAGLVMLLILYYLLMSDYFTRGWVGTIPR